MNHYGVGRDPPVTAWRQQGVEEPDWQRGSRNTAARVASHHARQLFQALLIDGHKGTLPLHTESPQFPAQIRSPRHGEETANLISSLAVHIEDRLRNTKIALQQAAATLTVQRGDTISIREIEGGLVEMLQLRQIGDILDRDIDGPTIVCLLSQYDFMRLRPELMCEIELEESIVPDGVEILLTEAEVKQRGEVWSVHKNDADPFPSSPHAHNYRLGLKMDLGNGDIYSYKKKVPSGRLSKTLLLDFRDRILRANSSIVLPPLAV